MNNLDGRDEFVGGMWVNIIDILLSGLRLVTDVEISCMYKTFIILLNSNDIKIYFYRNIYTYNYSLNIIFQENFIVN